MRYRTPMPHDDAAEHEDDRDAEDRASPSGAVVYKAIRGEGDEELERPSSALFWSGVAAGLSMGFSLVAEAVLRSHLPDAPWRPRLTKRRDTVGGH